MTKLQVKKLNQTLSKKCRLCFTVSLAVVLLLSLGKIIVSNQTATLGRDLEAIKQETDLIQQQNLQLKSQLAVKTGGLNELSQQALSQGFTDKPTIKYLNSSTTVAQKLPWTLTGGWT